MKMKTTVMDRRKLNFYAERTRTKPI